MNKPSLFAVIMLLSLCACRDKNKDKITSAGTTNINGLYLRDINAQDIDTLGNPDTRIAFAGITFMGYPNPSDAALALYVNLPADASVTIFSKAVQYPSAILNDVGNQGIFSAAPASLGTYALTAGGQTLQINSASFLKGYYKIFMVAGADTLWDNIWIKR